MGVNPVVLHGAFECWSCRRIKRNVMPPIRLEGVSWKICDDCFLRWYRTWMRVDDDYVYDYRDE